MDDNEYEDDYPCNKCPQTDDYCFYCTLCRYRGGGEDCDYCDPWDN